VSKPAVFGTEVGFMNILSIEYFDKPDPGTLGVDNTEYYRSSKHPLNQARVPGA